MHRPNPHTYALPQMLPQVQPQPQPQPIPTTSIARIPDLTGFFELQPRTPAVAFTPSNWAYEPLHSTVQYPMHQQNMLAPVSVPASASASANWTVESMAPPAPLPVSPALANWTYEPLHSTVQYPLHSTVQRDQHSSVQRSVRGVQRRREEAPHGDARVLGVRRERLSPSHAASDREDTNTSTSTSTNTKPPNETDTEADANADGGANVDVGATKSKTEPAKANRERKPINPYIAFTLITRRERLRTDPFIGNKQLVQEIGRLWNDASDDEKSYYASLARRMTSDRLPPRATHTALALAPYAPYVPPSTHPIQSFSFNHPIPGTPLYHPIQSTPFSHPTPGTPLNPPPPPPQSSSLSSSSAFAMPYALPLSFQSQLTVPLLPNVLMAASPSSASPAPVSSLNAAVNHQLLLSALDGPFHPNIPTNFPLSRAAPVSTPITNSLASHMPNPFSVSLSNPVATPVTLPTPTTSSIQANPGALASPAPFYFPPSPFNQRFL